MQIADRANVRIAGIAAAHARRISDHSLQLLPDRSFRLVHQDVVVIRLRHFSTIGSGQFGRRREQRLWFGEYSSSNRAGVKAIKPACNLAREFNMRYLIFAYWYPLRLINQDVCRLKQRIAKKAVHIEVFLAQILLLFFICRHTLQPS